MSIKINTDFISNRNSYDNQTVKYIVIHNTDNYAAGANARAHAKAQHDGNFSGYSAHVYVDDTGAYQATPYDRGAWHIGVNYGGRLFGIANNRNAIGIEMCVQTGYNYEKAFQNTVDVCRQLMKKYNVDTDHVIQHYDACAKNCPSAIRAKGDWPRFKKLICTNQGQGSSYGQNPAKLYRVRKTWTDSKSQLGAYAALDNAKKNCPSGYSVYDETGKVIYTNKSAEPVRRNGLQATELKGLNAKELITKIGPLFTADQKKSGILASVSMAQFILESGWGKSGLTQKANNCFGMKKNLSGNTWPNSAWDGKSVVSMQTGEETDDGKAYTITAEFRKYNCIEDSIADHSAYLTGAKDGDKLRYEGLKGCKKYKAAAQIIKDGGYATSTSYVKALCDIIKEYGLTDYEVKKKTTKPADTTKPAATPFKVKVTADDLRIRKEPNLQSEIAGYTGKGIFTITEERNGWGKLKSGAGWICLTVSCVKRV